MGAPLMPSPTSRMVPSLPSEVTQGGTWGRGLSQGIPSHNIPPPGLYCYELDEKAVRPGYPKTHPRCLGNEGPLMPLTRFNCQGKTHSFKVPGPGGCGSGLRVSG